MKKVKDFIGKFRDRYKVLVLQDDTFVEKLSFRVPLWVFMTGSLAFLILVFIIFTLLLRYTPLQEYVIGENQSANRRELLKAYARIDSLDRATMANEQYLDNLKKVMSGTAGESIEDAEKRDSEMSDAAVIPTVGAKQTTKSKKQAEDEAVLRNLLELSTPVISQGNVKMDVNERGISDLSFYAPVKGMVTSSFDEGERHSATDIATKKDEPILSVLDGHVVLSAFTPSTGYVIIIQHANNLLSVYKHCSALLKKEGAFVKGGEVIALVGSTGELSTGPHLHFELWYKGNAVNAEDYINF